MFEVNKIQQLADSLGVDVLAKVIFSFSPDIILSPLALPRNILNNWVDELLPNVTGSLRDILVQLKNRPTFQEQYGDNYLDHLAIGKQQTLKIESRRKADTCLEEILSQRKEVYDWYKSIS
jgi:predicted RecB family endonuclease